MVVITGLVGFEMGAFQPLQGANEKISHFWSCGCCRDEKRGLSRVCLTIVGLALLVRAVFQHRAFVVLALEFAVEGVAVSGVAARPTAGAINRQMWHQLQRQRFCTGGSSSNRPRKSVKKPGISSRKPASTSETLFTISAAGLSPAASFAASARRFSCPDCAPAKCRRRS